VIRISPVKNLPTQPNITHGQTEKKREENNDLFNSSADDVSVTKSEVNNIEEIFSIHYLENNKGKSKDCDINTEEV
jgi:hypothetical protein